MGDLAGKRVLVVEDEYFIAYDLKRALARADGVVVGPAADFDGGMRLAEKAPIDAAVLDVNLEGAKSYAIADTLARRDVPFLFLTGYDGWALPNGYRDVPRLSKPCPMLTVVRTIKRLLACR